MVYTDTMRILIVPLILRNTMEANACFTRELAELLVRSGHSTAVSAPKDIRLSGVSLHPCPVTKKPFLIRADGRSYEEWMYNNGCLQQKYLQEDTDHLIRTIDAFHPDVMIVMDRPAACIAARVRSIPVCAWVHPAMYRSKTPPYKLLKGLNAVLSSFRLEQEHTLAALYNRCRSRVSPGTADTAGFRKESDISRIGVIRAYPLRPSNSGDPLILLGNTEKNTSSLRSVIKETFGGAPYPVYAWVDGVKNEQIGYLQFLQKPPVSRIPSASVLIHDGNTALYHQAAACGIPQIIVTDHTYSRIWNGQTAQRCGIGLYLFEEELTVSGLYEAYRQICSDDRFAENTRRMREEALRLGDLEKIIPVLEQIRRKQN